MERMDEILCHWASKGEAFPEGIRAREETGCCFTGVLETTAGPHDPPA
jgi:hypothetical protein